MLKLSLTIFFTLSVIAINAAEKIRPSDALAIKKFITSAQYQSSFQLPDPITEKAPNTKIWQILNSEQNPVGWLRHFATDTGCQSACLPLNFSMVFDVKGNYLGYFSKEPLSKKNHRLFKESDTMHMEMILGSDGPGLGAKLVPMDLVDGITMATKVEYQDKVVKDAALSTLRMLQYKRQTSTWIKSKK